MISKIYKHISDSIKNIFKNDILNALTKYEENKIQLQKYIYIIILLILISFKIFLFDYFAQIIYNIYIIINVSINIMLGYLIILYIIYFLNQVK
jgi:hypothetical protein